MNKVEGHCRSRFYPSVSLTTTTIEEVEIYLEEIGYRIHWVRPLVERLDMYICNRSVVTHFRSYFYQYYVPLRPVPEVKVRHSPSRMAHRASKFVR